MDKQKATTDVIDGLGKTLHAIQHVDALAGILLKAEDAGGHFEDGIIGTNMSGIRAALQPTFETLERAISFIDDVVPHPADEPEAEPQAGNGAAEPNPVDTRTALANAINGIVAMTEYEIEHVVDAVIGVMEGEDDGCGCIPEPTPRTFSTAFEGAVIARSGTRWFVPEKAARKPDELRFTRRLDDGGFSWWAVTPADVDYWHTHVSQGRALAFEFLDFVNNPERNEEYDAATTLPHIAEHMAKAVQADCRQDGVAHGFWTVLGEYLTDGTANR